MMRPILLAAAVVLATGSAFAQTNPAPQHKMHSQRHAAGGGQQPIDHGPFTPQANRAYQGGGEVLEGAPGGPPPMPTATPAGQTPRDAVSQ